MDKIKKYKNYSRQVEGETNCYITNYFSSPSEFAYYPGRVRVPFHTGSSYCNGLVGLSC